MVMLDHGGRHPGEVRLVSPPADLAGLVAHLSVQEGHGASTAWRVVPDVSPYVIASVTDLAGVRRLRVAVVGARTQAATADVAHRVLTVAVRLHPGSLRLLTGESARGFVDRGVAVTDVFAPSTLSQLELAHDAPQDVIVGELLRLLRRALAGRTLAPCLPNGRIGTVSNLARWLQASPRSLRDHMYRDIGMSPKRTLRILRLHRALRESRRRGLDGRSSGGGLWALVAHAAGYADQAHFTREARALLGEAPSTWYARGSAVPFKTLRRA
jgi:AraC-like DNA-binding protein